MRRWMLSARLVLGPERAIAAAGPARARSPVATGGSCSRTSPARARRRSPRVTPRGRHARVLTDYKRDAVAPDVSPRGGRIAFTLIGSRRVPDKMITMRIGGANAHSDHPRLHRPVPGRRRARLVARRAPDRLQPRLRADRQRQRRPHRPDDREPQRDASADADPRHRQRQARDFEAGGWSWSPDGTQLAGTFADLNSPTQASAIFTVELDSLDIAPDHPVAAERRQPGLLARRPADRLQLRLGGTDALQPVHDQPRRDQPAPAQPPAGELHLRAQVQPLGQPDRLHGRRAPHDLPPGAPDDRRRGAKADHARRRCAASTRSGRRARRRDSLRARGWATRASRRA